MLLENTSLNLCLHWLGFKVNHSLLIEPFLGFITLFKPVSDCIPFKLGRRKPCFLEHYMVYLTQRLRQYTPKKEAREDRLVVKLLYWDFGNLGASSPSVWRWESLEVGKRQLAVTKGSQTTSEAAATPLAAAEHREAALAAAAAWAEQSGQDSGWLPLTPRLFSSSWSSKCSSAPALLPLSARAFSCGWNTQAWQKCKSRATAIWTKDGQT